MENLKISLGMPVYNSIKTETVYSLLSALPTIKFPIHLNFYKGTYLHEARKQIVAEAQANQATHLMFIDGDIAFQPEGINRLISHHKQIVAGTYNMKQVPAATTIKVRHKDKFLKYDYQKFPQDKLFTVDAIGMGFMLIKLSVFNQIKKPYFHFKRWQGNLMGEDVYFCEKVQKAGLKIWCDPTITLGHIGDYLY